METWIQLEVKQGGQCRSYIDLLVLKSHCVRANMASESLSSFQSHHNVGVNCASESLSSFHSPHYVVADCSYESLSPFHSPHYAGAD